MTETNTKTAEAAMKKNPYYKDKREVRNDSKGNTTVLLHGVPIAFINHAEVTLTLYGDTRVSRKSCRLMNILVSEFGKDWKTDYGKVFSENGVWKFRHVTGRVEVFSGKTLTLKTF